MCRMLMRCRPSCCGRVPIILPNLKSLSFDVLTGMFCYWLYRHRSRSSPLPWPTSSSQCWRRAFMIGFLRSTQVLCGFHGNLAKAVQLTQINWTNANSRGLMGSANRASVLWWICVAHGAGVAYSIKQQHLPTGTS